MKRAPIFRSLPGDEVWVGQHNKAGERTDLAARLWPKVRGPWHSGLDDIGWPYEIGEADCWEWIPTTVTGSHRMVNGRRVPATVGGYGRIHVVTEDGRYRLIGAHVAAYLVGKGEFPRGFVIAHSCDNRLCCNPWHLAAVPQVENVRDAAPRARERRWGRSEQVAC